MTSTMTALSGAEKQMGEGKFCANVADVLHAIAQPLTVLQVRLDEGVANSMNANELRLLIADSSHQVERLCNLFGFMQGFVAAQSTEPDLSEQDVGLMLEYVAEGMELFYREARKSLCLRVPARRLTVMVDRTRMYQALSRILLVAFEVSLATDVVELTGSSSGECAKIVVQNLEPCRALGKESALKLALAQANIERQGGSMSWTAEPFYVEIELRAAPWIAS